MWVFSNQTGVHISRVAVEGRGRGRGVTGAGKEQKGTVVGEKGKKEDGRGRQAELFGRLPRGWPKFGAMKLKVALRKHFCSVLCHNTFF